MARICEKNTCPRGIATHDPKFKAKYIGHKDHIVKTMRYIAEDVRRILASLGKNSLNEICGDTTLLAIDNNHLELINELNWTLGFFLHAPAYKKLEQLDSLSEPISQLNASLLADLKDSIQKNEDVVGSYDIINTDRSASSNVIWRTCR